jgi:hypothetical protein
MRKLALIGMVVAGLLLTTSTAWSKPTGMSSSQFQALIDRNAVNLPYGQYEYPQQTVSTLKVTPVDVNQKLEEIGAWAVPSKPLVSEKLAGLDLQTPQANVSSTSQGFDWNDAGIGAGLALVGVLGIGAVLTVRHQHTPIAH